MTKEEILNGMSEEEFYDMYPDQESWENAQQMKLGGLSGAPHNGQPTADEFFSYGSHVNDGLNIPMSNPFYAANGGTPYYGGPIRPYDMGGNTASPMNYGAFSVPMQYGGSELEYGGVIDPGNNQDYPILEQGGKSALMDIIKAHSKKMRKAYEEGGDTVMQGGNSTDEPTKIRETFKSVLKRNIQNHMINEQEKEFSNPMMNNGQMDMGGFAGPGMNYGATNFNQPNQQNQALANMYQQRINDTQDNLSNDFSNLGNATNYLAATANPYQKTSIKAADGVETKNPRTLSKEEWDWLDEQRKAKEDKANYNKYFGESARGTSGMNYFPMNYNPYSKISKGDVAKLKQIAATPTSGWQLKEFNHRHFGPWGKTNMKFGYRDETPFTENKVDPALIDPAKKQIIDEMAANPNSNLTGPGLNPNSVPSGPSFQEEAMLPQYGPRIDKTPTSLQDEVMIPNTISNTTSSQQVPATSMQGAMNNSVEATDAAVQQMRDQGIKTENKPNYTARDMAKDMFGYEGTSGSATGTGLSDYGYHDPQFPYGTKQPDNYKFKQPGSVDEALSLYDKEISPNVNYFDDPALQGRGNDFYFNAGRDPRTYMLDQYLRTVGDKKGLANRGSYNKDVKTADWTPELQKSLSSEWDKYKSDISKLPRAEQIKLLDEGRKFYYQNTFTDKKDSKPGVDYWNKTKTPDPKKKYYHDKSSGFHYEIGEDGSLSPAYGKSWKGRIDLYNKYQKYGGFYQDGGFKSSRLGPQGQTVEMMMNPFNHGNAFAGDTEDVSDVPSERYYPETMNPIQAGMPQMSYEDQEANLTDILNDVPNPVRVSYRNTSDDKPKIVNRENAVKVKPQVKPIKGVQTPVKKAPAPKTLPVKPKVISNAPMPGVNHIPINTAPKKVSTPPAKKLTQNTGDMRKAPDTGVVVDKRNNQAYYIGKKQSGSFPVLTGKNVEGNYNPYNVTQLGNNPKLRNTPVGYYKLGVPSLSQPGIKNKPLMEDDGTIGKPGSYYNYIQKDYLGKIRDITPISAYGQPAPVAKDLGFHRAYSDNAFNPKDPEFVRRTKLLNSENPNMRCTSYGCINVADASYDEIARVFPTSDTLMVLDSDNPLDAEILRQFKIRAKQKKYGGLTRAQYGRDHKSTNPADGTYDNFGNPIGLSSATGNMGLASSNLLTGNSFQPAGNAQGAAPGAAPAAQGTKGPGAGVAAASISSAAANTNTPTPESVGLQQKNVEMKGMGTEKELDVTTKDRPGFDNEAMVNWGIAGINTLAGGLEQAQNVKNKDQLSNLQLADNAFVVTPATAQYGGSRGDYDPNSGMFRPNSMVPVQFPGYIGYSAYGGSFQDGGMQEQAAPQQEQIMQGVAAMLQQGAQPEQVAQQLVQMGIPQEQVMQIIQAVMQQMEGGEEQPIQPAMRYGGYAMGGSSDEDDEYYEADIDEDEIDRLQKLGYTVQRY